MAHFTITQTETHNWLQPHKLNESYTLPVTTSSMPGRVMSGSVTAILSTNLLYERQSYSRPEPAWQISTYQRNAGYCAGAGTCLYTSRPVADLNWSCLRFEVVKIRTRF